MGTRLHLPRLSLARLSLPRPSGLTQPNPAPATIWAWLALSGALAVLYSGLAVHRAWADPFTIQDDARQHVFWMQRFLDPELFPKDLIADYFQSVAPWGYRLLYQGAAMLGLDPLSFNKLLPLPITLGITLYCFRLTLALLPVPFAAFLSTVLLNQALWIDSDLASATPRAFIYPLLLAFLFYLVRGALLPCLGVLLFQGLFYPQTLLLSLGVLVLRLLRWGSAGSWEAEEDGSSRWGRFPKLVWADRAQRRWSLVAIATALAILIIYALQSSAYGPTITKAEALSLPEFWPKGRSSFFSDNWWQYWFRGRSGILHRRLFTPATLALALLLPYFCRPRPGEQQPRLPLLAHSRHLSSLIQLTLASIAMFFIAHALLFRLHLPSRYVQHSLRIVLAVGAAIAITAWIHSLAGWIALGFNRSRRWWRAIVAGLAAGLLMVILLLYPLSLKHFLATGYVSTPAAYQSLYQFLAQQPKDIVVASLSRATDGMGTFAARSAWVSREHSIPYHLGYYRPLRQRIQQLIAALYAPDLAPMQQLIRDQGITHLLLDQKSFDLAAIQDNDWLLQFQPETDRALQAFQTSQPMALADPALQTECSVYNSQEMLLLSADCLSKSGLFTNVP